MEIRSIRRRISRAVTDLATHGSLPGYSQLPCYTRWQLNTRALAAFIASAECLYMLSSLVIWELLAMTLVWHFDLRAGAATLPPMLACIWLWPWLADARRRHIDQLLGRRWPS